jgi:hypothetical protein
VPPISSSRFTAALRSELADNAAQLDSVEDLFTVIRQLRNRVDSAGVPMDLWTSPSVPSTDRSTAMTGGRSRPPA